MRAGRGDELGQRVVAHLGPLGRRRLAAAEEGLQVVAGGALGGLHMGLHIGLGGRTRRGRAATRVAVKAAIRVKPARNAGREGRWGCMAGRPSDRARPGPLPASRHKCPSQPPVKDGSAGCRGAQGLRLRVGELDFIVGRLEPGDAAPDLDTEALYAEPVAVIVAPGHPLAAVRRPTWAMLAGLPWVLPPAWAASRAKLQQLFHKHRLDPPADLIESTSHLVTLTFLQQRGSVGFVAADVARQLQAVQLAVALPIPVPIELPPVGILRLRAGLRTAAGNRLLALPRAQAAHGSGRPPVD